MKRIKLILVVLFVCALGYGGYSAYNYVTMTETERFLLANIEALAIEEPGGSGDVWIADSIDRFVDVNGFMMNCCVQGSPYDKCNFTKWQCIQL